jgi:hypothetical protein
MKKIGILVLTALILSVMSSNTVSAQSALSPIRTVGAAEVYYFKEKNKSRAQVRIYLIGKAEDIGTKKDTLSVDVIFEVDGQKLTKPKFANLAFTAYSPEKSKYQSSHDMELYSDTPGNQSRSSYGTKLLKSMQYPGGGIMEVYLSPPIEYDKILKIITASVSGISLGKERTALKKGDIQAIKDLNSTVEK